MKAYLEIAALNTDAKAPAPIPTPAPTQAQAPTAARGPAVIMPRQAAAAAPTVTTAAAPQALAQPMPTPPTPSLQPLLPTPVPSSADATTATPVTDQADGLRRLFAHKPLQSIALMANPFVVWSGVALERLAAQCQALGHRVLVVDAADTSPQAPESAALGLAGCIDRLPSGAFYLAARGLPRSYVDTRGGATRLLDELAQACPEADTLLVHAEMTDLARIFKGRTLRPLLLAADQVDSLKHAYAGWKLLAQRCQWLTADLMLLAAAQGARNSAISSSLAQTADRYFGGLLIGTAVLDPMDSDNPQQAEALAQLLISQLQLPPDEGLGLMAATHAPPAPAAHRGWPAAGHQAWQTRPEAGPGLWA